MTVVEKKRSNNLGQFSLLIRLFLLQLGPRRIELTNLVKGKSLYAFLIGQHFDHNAFFFFNFVNHDPISAATLPTDYHDYLVVISRDDCFQITLVKSTFAICLQITASNILSL